MTVFRTWNLKREAISSSYRPCCEPCPCALCKASEDFLACLTGHVEKFLTYMDFQGRSGCSALGLMAHGFGVLIKAQHGQVIIGFAGNVQALLPRVEFVLGRHGYDD